MRRKANPSFEDTIRAFSKNGLKGEETCLLPIYR